MPLHVSSKTALIIRRSKLYYTVSGIVALCRWPSGALDGHLQTVAYTGILFRGVQQIQLWTEDRENGDLGAVAP